MLCSVYLRTQRTSYSLWTLGCHLLPRLTAAKLQRTINRMGKPTLGASRFTLLGIIAVENNLAPARALLNHRQARFA